MIIELTAEERAQALREARRRQSYNQNRGISGRNGGPESGSKALLIHQLGAGGEMAVAKYLGLQDFLFEEESPSPGSADLPFGIDVKTTDYPGGRMIVQPDDDPSKTFVQVSIVNRVITIEGWLEGFDCMDDAFWDDPVGKRGRPPRPAFFVPRHALKPITQLREIVSQQIKQL